MGISISGLSKRFGNRWAVRDLTLEVRPGEIVGLLGPNGAGKSTTMKMLTGILRPSGGEARVNGFHVDGGRPQWRMSIGYLPEQNPLYVDLYIKEYLRYVASLYRISASESAVRRVLALTGLEGEQHRRIGVLSKGYRQRVGLAAALIHDPQTLILDEPTSGLDPNQIVEIRQAIRAVGEQKAIILSSHIMQEVEATCDRVAIIDHGKLVMEGATSEIMGKQTGQTVIVGFTRRIDKSILTEWFPGAEIESLPENEWAIRSAGGEDIRKEIFQRAVERQLEIITLYKRRSHLEDVFRSLTSEEGNSKRRRGNE